MGNSGRVLQVIGVLLLAAVAGLAFGGLLAAGDGIGGIGGGGDGAGASASPSESSASSAPGTLTLAADPTTAAVGQRLTLRGILSGADEGVGISAQRQEGSDWADFPADTTTGQGGTFELPIELGRQGPNVLRVVSETGVASEPVTVTIS